MDISLATLLLSAASGVVVGLFLAVFGGGGSVLAAPLLIYVVGIRDPHVAIGTSAAGVALNALAGLSGHARAGRVKWPCAALFAAAGITGSIAGSTLAKRVDGDSLLLFFALAMALIALSMLRPAKSEGDPAVRLDRALTLRLAPMGLAAGFAAGFFGIGGGQGREDSGHGSGPFLHFGGTVDRRQGRDDLKHGGIVDAVEDGLALAPGGHEALLAQQGQVLRQGRLGQAGGLHQGGHGQLLLAQTAQDHQALFIAQRPEQARGLSGGGLKGGGVDGVVDVQIGHDVNIFGLANLAIANMLAARRRTT